MSKTLESLTLEEGKSDALRNALASISEASASDGGPRYSSRVCRALARIIVCRSYAKPVMELSHLLVCASTCDGQYENVFWGVDRASVSEFRRVFADFDDTSRNVLLTSSGVALSFGDSEFQISYGRMPFLAALLEFMIMSIGYSEIDDLTASLRKGRVEQDEVLLVAKSLQRSLYQYLKDHIPPAQRQRRERHFLSFVVDKAGNRNGANAISDEIVLNYWVAYCQSDDIEARTYRGVYETARKLIVALDGAEDRLSGSRAASIGSDFEAGEIDPADFEAVTTLLDEGESPLSNVLEACGDQVKFVNGSEVETLTEIPLGDGTATRIPLSVLRNAVFGALQLRLTTALRRKSSLGNLFEDTPSAFYQARLQAYRDVIENTERVALAAFWVLHQNQRSVAIEMALKLAPDLHWEGLLEGADADTQHGKDENVISFSKATASQRFFASQPRAKGDELQALLAEAKRAWRGINRVGFKDDPSPEVIDIIQTAVPNVLRLMDAVYRFLERDTAGIDWARYEQMDKETFAATLSALYQYDDEAESHAS